MPTCSLRPSATANRKVPNERDSTLEWERGRGTPSMSVGDSGGVCTDILQRCGSRSLRLSCSIGALSTVIARVSIPMFMYSRLKRSRTSTRYLLRDIAPGVRY